MKLSHALAASALALSAQAGNATSLPPCPSTSHLVDTIATVGAKTAGIMKNRLAQLDRETTDQIVALTINDKGNYGYASMRDLGIAYTEKCKIGSKTTDRGVLVTYEQSTHNYAIEISRGLEGVIPDLAARRKILDAATLQCEKRSPGCILDKSTIQIEQILRTHPVSQKQIGVIERNHSQLPSPPKVPNQDTYTENSLEPEDALTVGGIMLTSLIAGLGVMGYRRNRSRTGFRGNMTTRRGGNENRYDNSELQRLNEQIKRLTLELSREGFILGDLGGGSITNHTSHGSTRENFKALSGIRSYYAGLTNFAESARLEFDKKIAKYSEEKERHDAIYGASSHVIDIVGMTDNFQHVIGQFTGDYQSKNIPGMKAGEGRVSAILERINRANQEYGEAINFYNEIPGQVGSRRIALSTFRTNTRYEQNERAYRTVTGDSRFRSFSLSGRIRELTTILETIEGIHRSKRGLAQIPTLFRKYDDIHELIIEYIGLGATLRQLEEAERQRRIQAARDAEEEALLERRRSATVQYGNRTEGGGSRGREPDVEIPARGGAEYAGGGTEVRIEPERNDSGGIAGIGNDDNEDK